MIPVQTRRLSRAVEGHVVDHHLVAVPDRLDAQGLHPLFSGGALGHLQQRGELDRVSDIVQAGHPQPQRIAHGRILQRLREFRGRQVVIGRIDVIHEKAGPEDREGDQQQQHRLPDPVANQEPALRRGREQQHRHRRRDEDEDAVDPVHVEKQKVGVEDEQERQRRGAQAVEEGDDPGLDRIAA